MKVALTGVSGYLGQLLLRALEADASVESILGLDTQPPKKTTPKLNFKQADVRYAPFNELLAGCDVLYHLAFIVEPPDHMSVTEIDEINIRGSERVFRGAIAAAVPKIVHASSVAAYGAHPDNPEIFREDTPLRPNADWYYSRAKGQVEHLLNQLQLEYPKTVVIRFRPSIFLGPGIANSMGKLYARPFLLCINRQLKTDLCWDEDVAEAFRLALHYPQSDIFNLAAEGPLSVDEAGKIAGKRVLHIDRRWLLPIGAAACALHILPQTALEWLRTGAAGSILVSAERARARLGWRPRYTGAEVLIQYLGSLKGASSHD